MQYTIVLPDVGGEELDAVVGILYGASMTVSPALAPKIHALADMLGISVDLVRWVTLILNIFQNQKCEKYS